MLFIPIQTGNTRTFYEITIHRIVAGVAAGVTSVEGVVGHVTPLPQRLLLVRMGHLLFSLQIQEESTSASQP